MTSIQVEVEPAQVGLDEARLGRVDAHFRRYVDDGRLPGWLVCVSRGGKVAHLSCYGHIATGRAGFRSSRTRSSASTP
jgi:hypothetical protein